MSLKKKKKNTHVIKKKKKRKEKLRTNLVAKMQCVKATGNIFFSGFAQYISPKISLNTFNLIFNDKTKKNRVLWGTKNG